MSAEKSEIFDTTLRDGEQVPGCKLEKKMKIELAEKLDFLFVDNAAMQLIINPSQFDVIVTENMFGDILSDEASVISGSIGILPSASIGDKTGLFEPIHGSFPQGKGLNTANPVSSILSAAMLLNYLKIQKGADLIINAVEKSFKDGIMTSDLRKESWHSTSTVGNKIAENILQSAGMIELV